MRTMIDNAKIAKIEEDIKATDAKVKATDAKVNSINQVPASTAADAGKVLTVGDDGTVSWQTKGAGGGMKAFFDAGGKCSKSKCETFKKIIPVEATSNIADFSYMFFDCANLLHGPLLDTSKMTSTQSMFTSCGLLKDVPEYNTRNVTTMYNMFSYCRNLTSIPAFDVSNVTEMRFMFDSCSGLETIHMKNIGANLDIHYSTNLTREALLEIIGNLKTVTSTKTLTMGATNLAKLTEEDKAIATNKGWTLA